MDHECIGSPHYCGVCGADCRLREEKSTYQMLKEIQASGYYTPVAAIKRLRTRYGLGLREALEHVHTTLVG